MIKFENRFLKKISGEYDVHITDKMNITDMKLSSRGVNNHVQNINKMIENMDSPIFIPVEFLYKKGGDNKHRVGLFIKNVRGKTVVEAYDPNGWSFEENNDKYFNKSNMNNILKSLGYEVRVNIKVLNINNGYCIFYTSLFLLFRVSLPYKKSLMLFDELSIVNEEKYKSIILKYDTNPYNYLNC